jgi:DNA-binding CsgD family transcriptional regulator
MLVGRTAERGLIDGLVAGARVGRSGVLVLTGEAGIGKTTLLEYARQAAGDVRLLAAQGSDAEHDVPFGALAQLLRPTPDELDRLPGPQAQALGVALALREGPVADRLAVGAGLLSLLTRYGEHRPLGILVDDAHLLDRPSAEALAFACRRFLADSVFVVVAARPGEGSPLTAAGLPELALTGLDPDAVAQLAGSRAGSPLQRDRLEVLNRATGGNPLAVLELAADPTRSLPLTPGSQVPVPTALTDWFGRRVGRLGAAARTLLLLAATGGGDLAAVARAGAALGLELSSLADAEREGLVRVTPERLEFPHPLVHASVLAQAFPDERRAAHAALADAVPVSDPDRRAWHRCEAALGVDDGVAAELEALARRADARGAHAVSATAYERSALLSRDDPERARRLLSAGEAAWRAGDGRWATDLAAAALVIDSSPIARARGLGLEADVAARTGSPAEALRLYLVAADEVADQDPSRAILLLGEAVAASFYEAHAAACLDLAERLERLLTRPLSPAVEAVGSTAAGMARVLAGRAGTDQVRAGVRLFDAVTSTEGAGGADDEGGVAVRTWWLFFGPLFLREARAGRSLMRTALDQGRAGSTVSSLPVLLYLSARDGATTDRWANAEADYAESIALAGELGHTTELALSLAGLAWLEARQGRTDDCTAHALHVLDLCAGQPINIAEVWARYALGELALAGGDIPAAVDRLTELTVFLTEIDLRDPDMSPAPDLAEALLRNGDRAQAALVADEYAAAAQAKGLPWARARAARVRGLLAGDAELDEHFEAALALHAQTLDVFETARTRLAFGARLRRTRRRADARPQLRAALDAFERLGAQPWADAAAAELAATGEQVARAGTADSERLTPRELQIAVLLAEGRTTRETAAALFLSPKTVEYHLRHVYTKLDIASRAELVARLG